MVFLLSLGKENAGETDPAGNESPAGVEMLSLRQRIEKEAVRHCVAAGFADGVCACALCNGSGIGWRFECRQTVGAEYEKAIRQKKAAPGGEGQKKMFPDCAEILQRLRPPHECDAQHAGFTRAALPLSAPEDQYSGFICLPMR